MKKEYLVLVVRGLLLCQSAVGGLNTQIKFNALNISENNWQCTYNVINYDLMPSIREFTIYFDPDLFEDIVINTLPPLSDEWDELIWQPEKQISKAGGYDVLGLGGIGIQPGNSIEGFSVGFKWIGSGLPNSQPYEIVDPTTFAILDSGDTIPEPATFIVFCIGGVIAFSKRRG